MRSRRPAARASRPPSRVAAPAPLRRGGATLRSSSPLPRCAPLESEPLAVPQSRFRTVGVDRNKWRYPKRSEDRVEMFSTRAELLETRRPGVGGFSCVCDLIQS